MRRLPNPSTFQKPALKKINTEMDCLKKKPAVTTKQPPKKTAKKDPKIAQKAQQKKPVKKMLILLKGM